MAAHLFVYTLQLICTRSVVRKEYRGQVLFQKKKLNTIVGVTIGKLFPASKARGAKKSQDVEMSSTSLNKVPPLPLYHFTTLLLCHFSTLPPCHLTTLLLYHLATQLQHIHNITDHRWPHAKSPGLLLKGFPLKGRFL